MSTKEWFKNIQKEYDDDWNYRGELESIKFTEEILQYIEANKIRKNDLAKQLQTSPPYVSKILNSNCNFTLKSIYRICYALNLDFIWKINPTRKSEELFVTNTEGVSNNQTLSIDSINKSNVKIYELKDFRPTSNLYDSSLESFTETKVV